MFSSCVITSLPLYLLSTRVRGGRTVTWMLRTPPSIWIGVIHPRVTFRLDTFSPLDFSRWTNRPKNVILSTANYISCEIGDGMVHSALMYCTSTRPSTCKGPCGSVAWRGSVLVEPKMQEETVHVLVVVYISLSTLGFSDFGKTFVNCYASCSFGLT